MGCAAAIRGVGRRTDRAPCVFASRMDSIASDRAAERSGISALDHSGAGLRERGLEVLVHRRVAPNDCGLR